MNNQRRWVPVDEPSREGAAIWEGGLFQVVGVAASVGVVALMVKAFPDAPGSAIGVAVLVMVSVVALAFHLFARARGAAEPFIDLRTRPGKIAVIGLALALLLTIALLANDLRNRARAAEAAREAKEFQDRRRAIENSPDFKAGQEYIRRRGAEQQDRQR